MPKSNRHANALVRWAKVRLAIRVGGLLTHNRHMRKPSQSSLAIVHLNSMVMCVAAWHELRRRLHPPLGCTALFFLRSQKASKHTRTQYLVAALVSTTHWLLCPKSETTIHPCPGCASSKSTSLGQKRTRRQEPKPKPQLPRKAKGWTQSCGESGTKHSLRQANLRCNLRSPPPNEFDLDARHMGPRRLLRPWTTRGRLEVATKAHSG